MKLALLEILVFTETKFSEKVFSDKECNNYKNSFPQYKSLEEACWNGLFEEKLPELYDKSRNQKKLILWQVKHGQHFLELEYGEQPLVKFYSVNPYFFMGLKLLS